MAAAISSKVLSIAWWLPDASDSTSAAAYASEDSDSSKVVLESVEWKEEAQGLAGHGYQAAWPTMRGQCRQQMPFCFSSTEHVGGL
eukprot:CAMPEP_0115588304 /NCGR_PEP_ID=MMETSP0272-20121206/8646_1 /TAXON_ID=71861 /ORGANISM="Scrippsiella trochoidea, Strain CCMP3099" /LENGTH=85 /DNA_ID=CAMNT_0003023397 /DNA_START=155 /DNA_END=413 /DNA_ORIENTATION=-